MRKYYFLTILIVLFPMIIFAQILNVHKNDGTVHNFSINDIDSITFSGTSQIPTDGLVAYYPFNGNANDESENGNHGNVEGAILTIDRFGNSNSAYEFDGTNDKIVIGDVDILNNKTEATISVWINYSQHLGDYDPIITKGAIAQYESAYTLLYTPGGSGGLVCQMVEAFGTQSVGHTEPNAADDGSWHHIAVTLKDKTLNIYIDGIDLSDHRESNCSNIQNTNDLLTIGYNLRGGNQHNWFKGKIDDIRIYDRALNESEIIALGK